MKTPDDVLQSHGMTPESIKDPLLDYLKNSCAGIRARATEADIDMRYCKMRLVLIMLDFRGKLCTSHKCQLNTRTDRNVTAEISLPDHLIYVASSDDAGTREAV